MLFFFLIKNYSLSITYFGQDLVCNNPFGVGQILIYLWSNSSNWVEIFVIIMNYVSWELFSTFFGLEGCSMFSYLNMFCWNSRTALHYWRCMRGAIMHGGHICLCWEHNKLVFPTAHCRVAGWNAFPLKKIWAFWSTMIWAGITIMVLSFPKPKWCLICSIGHVHVRILLTLELGWGHV